MRAVVAWACASRIALIALIGLVPVLASADSPPLATLRYTILGTRLQVTPTSLSVPKNIAGSVLVQLVAADGSMNAASSRLGEGAYVEATLRGPAFDARRLVAPANQPMMLPPLSVVGDYRLDNIRLIDEVSGEVRLEATPSSVPVQVFDEVLVSRVTSRPLSAEEIQERGIVIDQSSFRAVEFQVGFVLDGKTIPVKFPVVAPSFSQSTEIIPKAELERRIVEAQAINQQIALNAEFPEALQQARLNIQIEGINFQEVEIPEQDLRLSIPPIPALMVIPGNIGYLHQFFSVQIFTENAAPANSGLSAFDIQARLSLPPGADRLVSTNHDEPGDDPLRFARVGPDKVIQPVQSIVQPGADDIVGTADDVGRLYPGEAGKGEFLVEGLQEGLHVIDLNLTANLDGLAAGTVKITGRAAGSVLVRNPKFSMAFCHPRTVRAGEPYDADVTVLNTSLAVANFVSVSLAPASLSGGVLLSESTVSLGTILPGQSATARFHIQAQRTGAVSFSNLTTGDDSVQGRFRLRMGIDERGVTLSPDTLALPDYVDALPRELMSAANRVLGQALSVATAGQLPASVKPINRSAVSRRGLELAEAGQRVRYGDPLERVLIDLLLDWQGGRVSSEGFDQIVRETDAGQTFRTALMHAIEAADPRPATTVLLDRVADIAGRSEAWILVGASEASVVGSLVQGDRRAGVESSLLPRAAGYAGTSGQWIIGAPEAGQTVEWQITNTLPQVRLEVVRVETNGLAQVWSWTLDAPPANACYHVALDQPDGVLQVDTNCDGFVDGTIPVAASSIRERDPEFVSVRQDTTVDAGRALPSCIQADLRNFGTVLAVLFSKPMTQATANVPAAYILDNGSTANSVQMQPGGRVALLNMQRPVSAIVPRTLTIQGVTDVRGHPMVNASLPVVTTLRSGVGLRGRVARADGSPAAGIPVTLTMYDQLFDDFFGDCSPFVLRVCQVQSDSQGLFEFDFLISGMEYSVSATDTAGLSAEASDLILESSEAGEFVRNRLLALANSPSARNTLLGAFAVGALPEAIVAAENVDRALVRDLVPLNSPREGTVVPVALRFRGRGTVMGQVVKADGITPVAGAAVNLFADPGSREQGRGIFADSQGRFAFGGVPLGVFTLQAADASGLSRTISSAIAQVGQITNVPVVLSAISIPRTSLAGRVVEADGTTPHPNARVFIGKYDGDGGYGNVVAAVSAGGDGTWIASNIPADVYDPIALSVDGRRLGERRGINAPQGQTNQVNMTLPGTAVVVGRVENATGAPVPNALVAGGEAVVRTDAHGLFRLTGVPSGARTISAGLERNEAAGIHFPRLGSAGLEVISGIENFVVVRLRPAGSIIGRVLDAAGHPVPNVRVAMPMDEGFRWVDADGEGRYKFENVDLREWTVSAPSGEASSKDVSKILETLRTSGSEEEIQAAIGEAFAIFTGANDPYLNGSGAKFNPSTWGFTKANLVYDGQVCVADIRYLRQGTISGVVLNDQGVPIGARVRLTGIGPLPNGMPSIILRGERNTDPATGTFEFPDQALAGAWGLQVASPFYPTVLTLGGSTSSTEPDATNLVLRFPPVREVNGRLAGMVFEPDGQPAANINVKISFGTDYIIRTDDAGFFDTMMALPMGGYSVEGEDPVTGFRGIANVDVRPGITNLVQVRLLAKGGLGVTVLKADGSPASQAQVSLAQGSYPSEHFQGATDVNGFVEFQNIFEGTYSLAATWVSGPTTISGRAGAIVAGGSTSEVTVRLTPTGTIRGRFVERDLTTPVGFAQIALGDLGFSTTDTNGVFQVAGVPLGSYRLVAQDPVNGIGAIRQVSLSYDGEIQEIQLVEQARGEVVGAVISSYGNSYVPGASVTITVGDGLTPSRTVTTGPDGRFSFPGTPAGPFQLQASGPNSKLQGTGSGVLPENAPTFELNVALQALGTIAGTIYQPDGVTPATQATVVLQAPWLRLSADADASGRVSFGDVPLGGYSVLATSLVPGETRSYAQAPVTLVAAGPAPDFTLTLQGLGSLSGQVFESDGITPAALAQVTLQIQDPVLPAEETVLADDNGRFAFGNLPLAPYRVTALAQALGASQNGRITIPGQSDTVTMALGASGSLKGRLVRASGSAPVSGVDVLLTFDSQSGLPGRAFVVSAGDGTFRFDGVPVGAVQLHSVGPGFGGIARLSSALTANGQVLDVGDVPFNEGDPFVIAVAPSHLASDVSIHSPVDLVFNKALAPESIDSSGIFLRSGDQRVASSVQILATNGVERLVRMTPLAPLRSLTSYEVVVIDGTRVDALGGVVGRGPTDLVDRPLPRPFLSTFSTADEDPPVLVSLSPADQEVQVDLRSVIRLSFNEPIRTSGHTFSLTGPAGPVAGSVSLGVNGLVLVFTPDTELSPNASYTLRVEGVRDLAGNLADAQPILASFDTLDTLGPTIVSLRLGQGKAPIAGASLPIEAQLAVDEPGASVRFTADFVPAGTASQPPYRTIATLPLTGSVTFRAIAIDRYGNEGPFSELTLAVVPNEPPTLQLSRGLPAAGAIGSGQAFTLNVGAVDDLEVTNVTVVGLGAWNVSTQFSNGGQRTLSFVLPANTSPGVPLQFRAQATDALGVKSDEATLDLEVIDASAPVLTILSPATGATLNPAQELLVEVASADNAGDHVLQVEISGALEATQRVALASAPNISVTRTLNFPLAGVKPDGASLRVTARATDSTDHETVLTRDLVLLDTTGPRLSSMSPASGATGQSLWTDAVRYQFSEAIDPQSVAGALRFSVDGGESVSFQARLEQSEVLRLAPESLPLAAGSTYVHTLLPGLSDAKGNAWTLPDGTPIPAAGIELRFTTARILEVLPTNGAVLLTGQNLEASVQFEPGLGAEYLRFELGGGAPVDVALVPGASSAKASIPVPSFDTNVTRVPLRISALKPGANSFVLPEISLVPYVAPPDTNFVTVTGVAELSVIEGQSAMVDLRVEGPDAPIVLLDYPSTNIPPAFVSLGDVQIVNTATNGTGSARLRFHPLHDAAGTYTVAVRAAARNGKVGVYQLALTVVDDPTLVVTHWKAPVNGNLSDTSKWSLGLPGPGAVGVIDAEGTYTVNIDTSFSARGAVIAATNVTVSIVQNVIANSPIEVRSGRLAFSPNSSYAMTLNYPLVNCGELSFVSRYYASTLSGPGWIENRGRITSLVAVGGVTGAEATLGVPLRVSGEGELELPPDAFVRLPSGGSVTLAGTLDAKAGSRLRFENSGASRDFAVLAGARLSGTGSIRLEGANRILMLGDAASSLALDLNDSSSVAGVGTIQLLSAQTVFGTYSAPVVFDPTALATVRNATFDGPVIIQPGAMVAMDPYSSYTLTVNGILTNRGTLRQVANYYSSTISGVGAVRNEGVMDFTVALQGYTGSEAAILVPIEVPSGGRLVVNANGWVRIRAGELSVAGTLEMEPGSRLREENFGPARDLILRAGAQVLGSGSLRLEGANRLVFEDRTEIPVHLDLQDSSVVAGNGTVRLVGGHTVYGTYAASVEIASNAVVSALNTTFQGAVLIEPGATVAMDPHSSYTLTVNALLTNRGMLRQVANYYSSTIAGAGSILNEGLMDLTVGLQGYNGSEASLQLPVYVATGGRLLVNASGFLRIRSGELSVAGTLEIEPGGRLREENYGPARDLVLKTGAQILGTGTLRAEGSNRVVLEGSADLPIHLDLQDSSSVAGTGALRFVGNQTIYGTFSGPVQFSSSAMVNVLNTTFDGDVLIEPGSLVAMEPSGSYTLTMNGTLTNRGTLRQVANYQRSVIRGIGRIENEGLMDFSVGVGGYNQAEAEVQVPIHVPSGGRFLVPASGYVQFRPGGTLDVAGELEVEPGARLRFENNGAPRDLTLQTGCTLAGTGTLRFDGANRLFLVGDASVPCQLDLNDSTSVAGPGTLTLVGSHVLYGNYAANTVMAPGADIRALNATFVSNVVVESGATLAMDPAGSYTLTMNGTLTNRGTFRQVANYQHSTLIGSGSVENEGMMDFSVGVGGYNQAEAEIGVPVRVTGLGMLSVPERGYVNFRSGSSLTLAGMAEVWFEGRLRFGNGGEPRELILLGGASISGAGAIRIEGSNRLVLAGNARVDGGRLSLLEASTVTGEASATLRIGMTSASLYIDHSLSIPGSVYSDGMVTIANSGSTVTIGRTFSLGRGSGMLDNSGTLYVGAFANQGIVIGNAPIVKGLGLVRMTHIVPGRFTEPRPADKELRSGVQRGVLLEWEGSPGTAFTVERSPDLIRWTRSAAIIREATPGRYCAEVATPAVSRDFFRVVEDGRAR
jgi:hypothetical protein